ncbi:MAG: methyltransferase domain-containing protein [Candidatus Micrarchaeota archaeon]
MRHKDEIESVQVHYRPETTMEEYRRSYDYKKMRKLIHICGTGHKILDVGCGGGFIGKILKDNGNDYTGCDLQDGPIRQARKKGLKVIKAKAQDLPFKDNTFDIVIMPEVIEHFVETDKALKELKRVTKPGGKVIVTTPNFTSFRDRILVFFGHMPAYSMHVDHVKFFNRKRLHDALRKAGLRVKKIYGSALGIPIPGNAKLFFFMDSFLPTTMLECLIGVAEKKK